MACGKSLRINLKTLPRSSGIDISQSVKVIWGVFVCANQWPGGQKDQPWVGANGDAVVTLAQIKKETNLP